MILHAGMPRTGTTSLQQALFRDERVDYPRQQIYSAFKPSHGWLSEMLYYGKLHELDHILKSIKQNGNGLPLVLSDEGLCFTWHLIPEPSKQYLVTQVTQFVVCWRDYESSVASLYVACKRWKLPPLPRFCLTSTLEEFKQTGFIQQLYDEHAKRMDFSRLFPNLTYLPYSQKAVEHFYTTALNLTPPSPIPHVN